MTERKEPRSNNYFPENPFKSRESLGNSAEREHLKKSIENMQKTKNLETLNKHFGNKRSASADLDQKPNYPDVGGFAKKFRQTADLEMRAMLDIAK